MYSPILLTEHTQTHTHTHINRWDTVVADMTMGEISFEIIKECRGKRKARCSFCVTIFMSGISYKKGPIQKTRSCSLRMLCFMPDGLSFVYQ